MIDEREKSNPSETLLIMSLQVFVPVTDEMLDKVGENCRDALVPYSPEMSGKWLSIEINPDESAQPAALNKSQAPH